MITGRVDIVATALDALHHGAGTAGNTQVLRVQEIILPTGESARVPFISGNSFKHAIRHGAVEHALDVMGIQDGTLSKQVVDLLFSGGHLSKGGAAVNVAKARELARLFPVLSLCGYSAGNFMAQSKISVDNFHVACAENQFRMPAEVRPHPVAQLKAAAFRSEEFGTRHEATRNPRVSALLKDAVRDAQERMLSVRLDNDVQRNLLGIDPPEPQQVRKERKKKGADDGTIHFDAPPQSSQMIYEFQTLKAGTVLYGGINVDGLSDLEVAAFQAALSRACKGKHADGFVYHLGAKSAVGCGRVVMRFAGKLLVTVAAPQGETTSALSPADTRPQQYEDHLRDNKDKILTALEDAAS